MSEMPAVAVPLSVQVYTSSEPAGWSNSYPISGKTDAVLFDVVQLRSEATKLAEMIAASGKTLTTIFISHAHPDHFMGLEVVTEHFPKAQFVSTSSVVQNIQKNGPGMLPMLQGRQGADGPQRLVVPDVLASDNVTVEGTELRVVEFGEGESEHMATLYWPEAKALFCADLVYNQAHLYLLEKRLDRWIAQLNTVKKFAEENVVTLYPGHGSPVDLSEIAATQAYLQDFAMAVQIGNAAEAEQKMLSQYPDYHLKWFLKIFSIQAYFPNSTQ